MGKNKIVIKLANSAKGKINQKLDCLFDKNKNIDIFDYRGILTDKSNMSYSRNTNNFYGLDNVLKRYSGYSKEIYVATEHGVQMPKAENFFCVSEYRDNDSHVLLTSAQSRAKSLSIYTNKIIIPIGPYIQYAQTIYDEEIMSQIKANLGRTLLVFPQHTSEEGLVERKNTEFVEYVKKIQKEKGFDTVLACIYFYDFKQGLNIPYEKEGWVIVTAGHRQNKLFLDYLKTYIALSDHVIFQGYSSSVGYALAMGKPVSAYPYSFELTQKTKKHVEELIEKTAGLPEDPSIGERLYLETFGAYSEKVNERQLKWAEECISLSVKKEPEEIRDIFEMSKKLYWNFTGNSERILKKYGYS